MLPSGPVGGSIKYGSRGPSAVRRALAIAVIPRVAAVVADVWLVLAVLVVALTVPYGASLPLKH